MKPAKHTISDASFIGHYFKLLVIRLKQFKTAKHVALIGMVLVCVLARYIVLLGDKSQVKTQIVTEKYQKIRVRIPKLILIPTGSVVQKNNLFKINQTRFNTVETDVRYFMVNEVQ